MDDEIIVVKRDHSMRDMDQVRLKKTNPLQSKMGGRHSSKRYEFSVRQKGGGSIKDAFISKGYQGNMVDWLNCCYRLSHGLERTHSLSRITFIPLQKVQRFSEQNIIMEPDKKRQGFHAIVPIHCLGEIDIDCIRGSGVFHIKSPKDRSSGDSVFATRVCSTRVSISHHCFSPALDFQRTEIRVINLVQDLSNH